MTSLYGEGWYDPSTGCDVVVIGGQCIFLKVDNSDLADRVTCRKISDASSDIGQDHVRLTEYHPRVDNKAIHAVE